MMNDSANPAYFPASHSSDSSGCERIRDLMFDLLDTVQNVDDPAGQTADAEVRSHIAACADCEAYQADMLTVHTLLEQPMDDIPVPAGLADRVMAQIAGEHAQNSLTAGEIGSTERVSPPQPQVVQGAWLKWQRQPLVPAIAAVLLVLAGWMASTTLLSPMPGRNSALLSANHAFRINPGIVKESALEETDYVSNDYELDGQQIAYAAEDRILDPTWIRSGEEVVSDIPMSTHRTPEDSSFIVPEADQDDPLSSVVGF